MDLLIEAARRGKEVLVVVELKARFDEEANINWAERLEAVGAQVVYGIVGLKTHAKLLLVTRAKARGCGATPTCPPATTTPAPRGCTPTWAAHRRPGADRRRRCGVPAAGQPDRARRRATADGAVQLHRRLGRHIEQVAAAAQRGQPARIVVKINALTDPALIEALVRGQPGRRPIDLIVRGACMLPPGLPGARDNIRVRSVVGRFLEHTRVLYFRWGEATTTRRCTCPAPTG
jgi:polyphosphate kinase